MSETVITIVIPDGQEEAKPANILLRRGDNARIKSITFSTLADLVEAMHDLSLEVQEIEFAAEPAKKTTRKKADHPVAPKGAPSPQPVAKDFAEKQIQLF